VKKRFTETQIIGFLREAEAGLPVKQLCRTHGFSEASYYLWRSKFGGMSVSDAKRLKELTSENARLKKLLAESLLENEVTREVLRKNGSRTSASYGGAGPDRARLERAPRAQYEQMPRGSVPSLVKRLDALLDLENTSKDAYREGHEQILSTIGQYLVSHFNLRTAFPPFHTRFLVSRYAPTRSCQGGMVPAIIGQSFLGSVPFLTLTRSAA
jgi:putative transposase